jgi:hypothetical protein
MIRLPHLNWAQRLAIGAALAVIGLVGGLAGPASATDGNVTAAHDCTGVTITVTSHYDGGPIHIVIQIPPSPSTFDVAPLQTVTFRQNWSGATHLHATVTSSNGHLNGQAPGSRIEFDFVKPDGCGGTTSTAPAPTSTTTCSQAIPPRGDCGGTATTVATTIPPTPLTTLPMVASSVVRSPDTTAPAVPSSGTPDRGSAPAPSGPATTACVPTGGQLTPGARPCTLPTTGGGDVLLVVGVVAGFLILVGLVLVTAKRVDAWKNEGGE